MVSQVLTERFTFCCIRVDGAAERLKLESGLIALLAKHPIGSPSPDWLGRRAVYSAIRQSGLWNTQHVEGQCFGAAELDCLADGLAPIQ